MRLNFSLTSSLDKVMNLPCEPVVVPIILVITLAVPFFSALLMCRASRVFLSILAVLALVALTATGGLALISIGVPQPPLSNQPICSILPMTILLIIGGFIFALISTQQTTERRGKLYQNLAFFCMFLAGATDVVNVSEMLP